MHVNKLIAAEQTAAHWMVASAGDEKTIAVLVGIALLVGFALTLRSAVRASVQQQAAGRKLVAENYELNRDLIQITQDQM